LCGALPRHFPPPEAGRLGEAIQREGGSEQDLAQRRKGDERKVRLAARMRRETTMSHKWIAEHLAMGSWTHFSNLFGAE
jgi:hypothetical protein